MTAATPPARPSALAIFRNRSFTLLWTAQLISSMGTALTSLAASIVVFRLTGSALSVGFMLMATAAPTLLVGLLAGVVVDRADRKRIMIGADLLRALLALLIPFLLPFGVGWLYALVILSSATTQFFDPAQSSVLPEVASDEELTAANSMMTISTIGSSVVGFAAAGLLAGAASITWAFYLDAASFALSALCIALVRIAPREPQEATSAGAVFENLAVGLRFVRDTVSLRSLFIVFAVIFVAFGFGNALNLPFVLNSLGATEFEYGLLEGIGMIGFVLGSIVMANIGDRLHEGQWVAMSILAMGIAFMLFALSPNIWFALGMNVLISFSNAPSFIGRQLLLQRQTPRDLRGRVSSAFFVTRDVAFLIGMAAVGLADYFNPRLLLAGNGLLVMSCGVLALLLPGLRQPVAEWRRAVSMLRHAASAPGLGLGRAATLADIARLPVLNALSAGERGALVRAARLYDAPAGTAIVRLGERSDAAYFLLDGGAVAGREEAGSYRALEVLRAGDFFGEIAALTGVPRTANVIVEQPTTLLEVPAAALRQLMGNPQVNRLLLSELTTRMARLSMIDAPRFAGLDQQALRELRTVDTLPSGAT